MLSSSLRTKEGDSVQADKTNAHSTVQVWALGQGLGWPHPPPPPALVLPEKGAAVFILFLASLGKTTHGPIHRQHSSL